jgi:hypothetical protein
MNRALSLAQELADLSRGEASISQDAIEGPRTLLTLCPVGSQVSVCEKRDDGAELRID